ncbi:hypothetical protein OHA59_49475 [Streptomyces sp. NBC_01589]|uniref:hypothetical protein n=1 Tax=Streptomyces sp. NBC_01589 TaxID=2975886 RepID=UPI00386F4C55
MGVVSLVFVSGGAQAGPGAFFLCVIDRFKRFMTQLEAEYRHWGVRLPERRVRVAVDGGALVNQSRGSRAQHPDRYRYRHRWRSRDCGICFAGVQRSVSALALTDGFGRFADVLAADGKNPCRAGSAPRRELERLRDALRQVLGQSASIATVRTRVNGLVVAAADGVGSARSAVASSRI